MSEPLLRTPLNDLHRAYGARLVPFAGYEMPVQYPAGIIAEHNWTRSHAGLFDVSHMGQGFVIGRDHETTARALERLVPGDILGLGLGRIRYTQLLNEQGGILDDLMITRSSSAVDDGTLMLIVNAARKHADYAWIGHRLPGDVKLVPDDSRALVALQGPKAAEVMARHAPAADALGFMAAASMTFDGLDLHVQRSGYTGEDGFELSLKAEHVVRLAAALLAEPEVKPVGLGARDSLRLEAGLCLYGHDIDETTSPIEAGLGWSIGKRRRSEGGFIGAERVLRELAEGPLRKRVGIRPEGRAPAREGAAILDGKGAEIGTVTSGGFGPTRNAPIAMGYVRSAFAVPGTTITLMVRDKPVAATVAPLPFVPHRYHR